MSNLVRVTLHGDLGDKVGKIYELDVKSPAEAIRAVEICSKRKFYKYLSTKEKRGAKYQILINESPFLSEEPFDEVENLDINKLKETELYAKRKDLKSIDIIPVIEGSGGGGNSQNKGILGVVLGIVLIIAGIVFIATPFGAPLIVAGIGLTIAGIAVLISSPPEMGDFGDLEKKRQSYLFGGPANRINEGGPVPIGYGRVLVGSQTISSAYYIKSVSLDYFETGE